MSPARLIGCVGKALASRLPRSLCLLLTLTTMFLSAVVADIRPIKRSRQSLLLHEGFWCRLELGLYHVLLAPLIAFLPARLAYGLACWQGDVRFHLDSVKRQYMLEGLERVMGEQLSAAQRLQITRDFFRISSCEAIDVIRILGKGSALKRLVEVRGMEHLEAALAAGKGAIVCGAHFGSYATSFALIGAYGFPLTAIARRPSSLNKNRTFIERHIFEFFVLKPLLAHMRGPYIDPRRQYEVTLQLAKVLRNNEVLGIALDPPVLPADRGRAASFPFLNGQVRLIPGAATIAQLMGAPVLMMFLYRSADWRHQVLEISAPVSMEGDTVTAFGRCLAALEEAIRRHPAHWHYWGKYALMDLGLLPEESESDCKGHDAASLEQI